MDCVRKPPKFCNWKSRPKISLSLKGVAREREGEDAERKSLLPSALAGKEKTPGAPARKRNPRRRVQWNDDRGDKLVQVLEFFPRSVPIHFIFNLFILGIVKMNFRVLLGIYFYAFLRSP